MQPSWAIRHRLTLIAMILFWTYGAASADQNKSRMDVERLGRIHAAAIYCGIETAHDFGIAVVEKLKESKDFDKQRNAYGLALLNASRDPPALDIGGDCAGLQIIYENNFLRVKRK